MKHTHKWVLVWQIVADSTFGRYIGNRRHEVYRCKCGEMGYPA